MLYKNKKRYLTFVFQMISAAVLAFVDQYLKKLAVEHLMNKPDIVLIENIIGLHYDTNTGGAWSMLEEHPVVLYILTAVLLICIIVYLFMGKLEGKILNISVTLILAGGVGNMIDRLSQGYVVDYIQTLFIDFPIFNFADILVVAGAFSACGILIYDIIKDERRKKQENADGNSATDC